MDGLTILMVLHNEIEYAKFSLQSIRLFADVENLSVVMIDNHLDDKLADWAKAQEDITYVYMDEGEMPFGKMLNEVCNGLRIKGDLLVMDAYYMLTPPMLYPVCRREYIKMILLAQQADYQIAFHYSKKYLG